MNLNHLKQFILISGIAIGFAVAARVGFAVAARVGFAVAARVALSTTTTQLTAQNAPTPANPPATSPDGRPVRAYDRNTNVNAINDRILAAARQGKSWVSNPLEIFTTLEGDLTATQYSLYLRSANGEDIAAPTFYALTYVTSDFRDDSIGGKWKQYKFRGCQTVECPGTPDGRFPILLVQEIRTANYCRRPNSEFYSSNPCP
jgi:hypothetical protein